MEYKDHQSEEDIMAGIYIVGSKRHAMSAGASPHESIGVPVASWIASECLLCWAGRWGSAEADAAGAKLRDSLISGCDGEGLPHQCYWLATAIAMGGMLRVRHSPQLPLPHIC